MAKMFYTMEETKASLGRNEVVLAREGHARTAASNRRRIRRSAVLTTRRIHGCEEEVARHPVGDEHVVDTAVRVGTDGEIARARGERHEATIAGYRGVVARCVPLRLVRPLAESGGNPSNPIVDEDVGSVIGVSGYEIRIGAIEGHQVAVV